MSKIIRTAIVGCGKVGHTHAQALQKLPQAKLVAAYSDTYADAVSYAQKYQIAACTDFEDMIKEHRVDAVSVCTPHPLHMEYILRAAKLGVHVLVEKPLASDLQSCDQAIEACRKHNVRLGVISQRRFYPPVQRMKSAIQAGKLGTPILASMVVMGWRSPEYYLMDAWRGKWHEEGGGVMVNQTVHQLDLLQWLMGPIEELFGYWDNLNHPSIEVEDTAVAVLRFKSGALGQFLVSNSQKPGFYGKIHIHGSNGASVGAQTEGGSPFIAGVTSAVEPPIQDVWTVPGEEHLLPVYQAEDRQLATTYDPLSWYHQVQIEDFLNALLEDREPLVNGEDGRIAVELFSAVYRSQRDHQPVKFPLQAESVTRDYDSRTSYIPFSHRVENLT